MYFLLLKELFKIYFYFQFKLISHAYEVLSDPKRRETYDVGGEEAIKGGGTGGGFDFHSPMDIFDMFFGGGGRRQKGAQKGKDVIHQMKVSLEDFYNGCTRKLSLKKKVICSKCDGMCFCSKFNNKWMDNFSYFQLNPYVVTPHLNHLFKMVQMMGHNVHML